jgi:hypothetical protein
MGRFNFIASRMLCMTAALILALLPVSHGLHLASCNHEHPSCHTRHTGHVHRAQCFSYGDGHAFNGSKSFRAVINRPQSTGGQRHNPSTCPFCQFFVHLMHGGCLAPSQALYAPQEIHLFVPFPNRMVTEICFFSRCHPRAPPIC